MREIRIKLRALKEQLIRTEYRETEAQLIARVDEVIHDLEEFEENNDPQ